MRRPDRLRIRWISSSRASTRAIRAGRAPRPPATASAPSPARSACDGLSTSGTATIVATSATVAHAIASSRAAQRSRRPPRAPAGRSRPTRWRAGSPTRRDGRYRAGARSRTRRRRRARRSRAPRRSPGGPPRSAPLPAAARASRRPSISIANPMVPRNAIVGSSDLMSPTPLWPSAIPASSSPTTTGTSMPRREDNTGPASPASTINVS